MFIIFWTAITSSPESYMLDKKWNDCNVLYLLHSKIPFFNSPAITLLKYRKNINANTVWRGGSGGPERPTVGSLECKSLDKVELLGKQLELSVLSSLLPSHVSPPLWGHFWIMFYCEVNQHLSFSRLSSRLYYKKHICAVHFHKVSLFFGHWLLVDLFSSPCHRIFPN